MFGAHLCDVPEPEPLHLSGAERQNPIRPYEEGDRYPAIVRELTIRREWGRGVCRDTSVCQAVLRDLLGLVL